MRPSFAQLQLPWCCSRASGWPTPPIRAQLAETGGFLLGNARRCGVPVERVESAGKVIHDFIAAAAKDASEAAAADSRFSEIFIASALPDQTRRPDPDAFRSCTVVIQQFDRLERHHDQTRRNSETGIMSPAF
jgi:hypothetical protein